MVLQSAIVQLIMENPVSRLQTLMSEAGLNQVELAEKLGKTKSLINKNLKDPKKVSAIFLQDIEDKLGWSARWIRTGVGPKRINERPESAYVKSGNEATPLSLIDETDVTRTATGSEFRDLDNGMVLMTIPLVDEYAYASYPQGWKDPEYIEELPKHSIVLPKRDKGRYRAFVVRGDSMDDGGRKAIYSGDVAVGREVEQDLWQNKLYMNGGGKDYIIVHQDGVFIKRIIRHDVADGIIRCASTNPDKELYPDFDVRLSEVYELYLIWKVERDWRH